MKKIRNFAIFFACLLTSMTLFGCSSFTTGFSEEFPKNVSSKNTVASESAVTSNDTDTSADTVTSNDTDTNLDENGYYYDLENVILYLDEFGKLPSNYITKNEAKKLGWNGGAVAKYKDGAAIGGDKFGNYEGLLPSGDSIKYTECDLNTNGKDSRGAKRLIFSNEPKYYYTEDHYESFTEYIVKDKKVIKAE